jgi:hypothetical protein
LQTKRRPTIASSASDRTTIWKWSEAANEPLSRQQRVLVVNRPLFVDYSTKTEREPVLPRTYNLTEN